MPKCLMVIKTSSLKFDDRLRKECLSLHDLGIEPSIVVLEKGNNSKKGTTDYQTPFHSISLFTRKIFPHKRFLAFKSAEMYTKFFIDILKSGSDIIWFHDNYPMGLIPFVRFLKKIGYIKLIIWDQHELQEMSNSSDSLFQKFYKFVCSLSDRIITANEPRKKYLEKFIAAEQKIYALENFPDKLFVDLPEGVLPESARNWLDGEEFLLAQGGANPNRYLDVLVSAFMEQKKYKLMIVGPYQKEKLRELRKKWGKRLDKRILFFGAVPQMSLVNFIDHAKASIILYENTSMNRWLCAPNRLYQALGRGTPVIVGANPPMADLVDRFKCGVAIKDDGRNLKSIQNGIKQLDDRYEEIHQNTQNCTNNWIWEAQKKSFEKMIPEDFLKCKKSFNNKKEKKITFGSVN